MLRPRLISSALALLLGVGCSVPPTAVYDVSRPPETAGPALEITVSRGEIVAVENAASYGGAQIPLYQTIPVVLPKPWTSGTYAENVLLHQHSVTAPRWVFCAEAPPVALRTTEAHIQPVAGGELGIRVRSVGDAALEAVAVDPTGEALGPGATLPNETCVQLWFGGPFKAGVTGTLVIVRREAGS